jgi:uncharacterized protein (DUF433 family)
MEIYVARFFRQEGVRPKIIRQAYKKLQEELKTPHPFAHADLRTNGVEIIRRMGNADLLGVIDKQHFFAQMKLGRITFATLTRLAEQWGIADGVIINPTINFGKPVVENSGVSTLIVANQYEANKGDAALVARLFRLTESGVRHAVDFERSFSARAA